MSQLKIKHRMHLSCRVLSLVVHRWCQTSAMEKDCQVEFHYWVTRQNPWVPCWERRVLALITNGTLKSANRATAGPTPSTPTSTNLPCSSITDYNLITKDCWLTEVIRSLERVRLRCWSSSFNSWVKNTSNVFHKPRAPPTAAPTQCSNNSRGLPTKLKRKWLWIKLSKMISKGSECLFWRMLASNYRSDLKIIK